MTTTRIGRLIAYPVHTDEEYREFTRQTMNKLVKYFVDDCIVPVNGIVGGTAELHVKTTPTGVSFSLMNKPDLDWQLSSVSYEHWRYSIYHRVLSMVTEDNDVFQQASSVIDKISKLRLEEKFSSAPPTAGLINLFNENLCQKIANDLREVITKYHTPDKKPKKSEVLEFPISYDGGNFSLNKIHKTKGGTFVLSSHNENELRVTFMRDKTSRDLMFPNHEAYMNFLCFFETESSKQRLVGKPRAQF